jgi:hypothetical protein
MFTLITVGNFGMALRDIATNYHKLPGCPYERNDPKFQMLPIDRMQTAIIVEYHRMPQGHRRARKWTRQRW